MSEQVGEGESNPLMEILQSQQQSELQEAGMLGETLEEPEAEAAEAEEAPPEPEPEPEEVEEDVGKTADDDEEGGDEGEEEDEVEASAEEPVRKSRAQERIRQLARERKELQEQVQRLSQQQQQSQVASLKDEFTGELGRLREENQSLAQSMKQLLEAREEGTLSETDKGFKEYLDKHIKPYIPKFDEERQAVQQKLEQLSEKEKILEAKAQEQEKQRALAELKQQVEAATREHALSKLAESERDAMHDVAYEATLAMQLAFGEKAEESAKHVAKWLEDYHQARTRSKKLAVKQKKVSKKQESSVVNSATGLTKESLVGTGKLHENWKKEGSKGSYAEYLWDKLVKG